MIPQRAPVRPLKVIHALGWYFPDSSGGTEVYVDGLVRHLSASGIESTVAAAADDDGRTYEWGGSAVYRYRVGAATREEMARRLPHDGFDAFASWLRAQHADIYHQHSWTRGCGPAHFRLARALGLKTVLTVHVPGVSCLRGTMMLDGTSACDGVIDVPRCSRCWGASRGIPASLAAWQGRHPVASAVAARLMPASRVRTAFRTPELVTHRQHELRDLVASADRVVAVCRWLFDTLAANGIPKSKLVCIPQGIAAPAAMPVKPSRGPSLRVGFMGRWDPVKGVHVLVDAFRHLPDGTAAELFVHGLPLDAAYERDVRRRAQGCPRIHILDAVQRADVPRVLAGFDVLAVPSLWLETGPLVVLEAFAVGTPVAGSNLGGIAELVTPGVNGWLLPHGDVDRWIEWLRDHSASTSDRQNLPRVTASVRSVQDVARDVAASYHDLVNALPAAS